jgi:hypothetical protein
MNIQCPSCRQPFTATVQALVDVDSDPEAKMRLLSGRLNSAQCPQCGTVTQIATPLLYHDSAKELMISFVPMELGLPREQQERAIGDLTRELMSILPKNAVKGYLFQPRQALTMQNLIDQVLIADGVTPEMLEAQRNTVRLIEALLQAPAADLPRVLKERDAAVNAEFFQAVAVMAQRAMQEGRSDLVQRLVDIQNAAAQHTTFGQQLARRSQVQEALVQEVAQALNALGEQASLDDFLDVTVGYAGQDDHLQALVGLVRPAMDYNFFEALSGRIAQAEGEDRERLVALRDRLLELTTILDQQAQLVMQDAVNLLQEIVNSPQPQAMIQDNLELIDDTFMAVLSANIENAQQRGDINISARLKQVYDMVVTALQANMRPELRFVNQLLMSETDEEARAMISERASEFGDALLEVMDAVGPMLAQQGETALVEKLAFLRQAAAHELA